MINQDVGRQNNSMSQPHLDSTPLGMNTDNGTPHGTNMNNRKTSSIDLIPVITKFPDPTPLILPTDLL